MGDLPIFSSTRSCCANMLECSDCCIPRDRRIPPGRGEPFLLGDCLLGVVRLGGVVGAGYSPGVGRREGGGVGVVGRGEVGASAGVSRGKGAGGGVVGGVVGGEVGLGMAEGGTKGGV